MKINVIFIYCCSKLKNIVFDIYCILFFITCKINDIIFRISMILYLIFLHYYYIFYLCQKSVNQQPPLVQMNVRREKFSYVRLM